MPLAGSNGPPGARTRSSVAAAALWQDERAQLVVKIGWTSAAKEITPVALCSEKIAAGTGTGPDTFAVTATSPSGGPPKRRVVAAFPDASVLTDDFESASDPGSTLNATGILAKTFPYVSWTRTIRLRGSPANAL